MTTSRRRSHTPPAIKVQLHDSGLGSHQYSLRELHPAPQDTLVSTFLLDPDSRNRNLLHHGVLVLVHDEAQAQAVASAAANAIDD